MTAHYRSAKIRRHLFRKKSRYCFSLIICEPTESKLFRTTGQNLFIKIDFDSSSQQRNFHSECEKTWWHVTFSLIFLILRSDLSLQIRRPQPRILAVDTRPTSLARYKMAGGSRSGNETRYIVAAILFSLCNYHMFPQKRRTLHHLNPSNLFVRLIWLC